MADNYVTSFEVVNYAGMLFNKGNTATPLSSLIGSRQKQTNHVEFVTGQEYTTGGGSQPDISEAASLTAPGFSPVGRSQKTNVTQIFHETVGVSYGKQSNMGTLSGLNVEGQQAAPVSELDFQTASQMTKIGRDIEYTFINGVYVKSDSDTKANRTRGLVSAATSNVLNLAGKPLGYWDVVRILEKIKAQNAPINDLLLWADTVTTLQLNADAVKNGLTNMPAAREVNGIAIKQLVTPLGTVGIAAGEFLPAGTALMLNLGVIAPVHQPVPGKGNFFLEPLAKVGAGERYQIFGQVGLDHGPEWYHGKFTGIATSFTPPENTVPQP